MDSDELKPVGKGIDLDEVESSDRHNILVVDDDPDTIALLKQILRGGGFNVMGAVSGHEALSKVAKNEPDLVLLDMMMPDMDGSATLSHLREMTDVPVIIVSARFKKDEIIDGLRLGADDYITKPFSNTELIERVRAVLRRAGRRSELNRLVFPRVAVTLDLLNQQLDVNGLEIHLTPKEFAFVSLLARSAPAPVSYAVIANEVFIGSSNTRKRANYLVYLLRRKLEEIVPGKDIIINIDRFGYKLKTEP